MGQTGICSLYFIIYKQFTTDPKSQMLEKETPAHRNTKRKSFLEDWCHLQNRMRMQENHGLAHITQGTWLMLTKNKKHSRSSNGNSHSDAERTVSLKQTAEQMNNLASGC